MKENNVKNLHDSINGVLNRTDKKVLARGMNYYIGGNIKALTLMPNGNFEAKVEGANNTYKVNINLDTKNRVSGIKCTCPYDYGYVCKHSVAVLAAIRNGEFQKFAGTAVQQKTQKVKKYPEVLADADRQELHRLIERYAERDEFFKYYIMSAMKLLPEDTVLKSIIKKITEVEEEYRDCNYRNRKYARKMYIDTVSEIIDNISDYFCDGYTLITFKVALFAYCSISYMNCYDYCDDFDELMNSTAVLVEQCIGKTDENSGDSEAEEMCVYAFEALERCFYANRCEDILTMLIPIGTRIVPELFKTAISELYKQNRISLEFAKDYFAKNGSDDDYVQFLSSNSEDENVCENFVLYCMEHGKLDMAEKLCLECLEKCSGSVRRIKFLSKLYDVYKASQNIPKTEETAKQLIINGATEYYGILKNMLAASGEWESKREDLLNELSDKTTSKTFEEILFKGEEYRTLLDYIETKDGEAIFTYGKGLAEHFPDEVSMVYRAKLEEIAENAGDRGRYKFICTQMCEMIKISDPATVGAMLVRFREQYKRRTAFMEELESVERELQKAGW